MALVCFASMAFNSNSVFADVTITDAYVTNDDGIRKTAYYPGEPIQFHVDYDLTGDGGTEYKVTAIIQVFKTDYPLLLKKDFNYPGLGYHIVKDRLLGQKIRVPVTTPGGTNKAVKFKLKQKEDGVTVALDTDTAEITILPFKSGVPKTGQTTSYATDDDGDLQMGTAWPNPRFTDNGDGTVTDNLTGLIWLKDANCFGPGTWSEALSGCNSLADPQCGLSDGSSVGDWRLPNVRELYSLIDFGNWTPALPTGHPFDNVNSSSYWAATTFAYGAGGVAWDISMGYGYVDVVSKSGSRYVWPVRAGQ
jgi:hypothetical protein